MKFSKFGQKFTKKSGILQLMDDLGKALASDQPINMLGGGNPAQITEVTESYNRIINQITMENHAIESISNYSTPQGDTEFIQILTQFFRAEYGWNVQPENIALTNGSQNAFFYLFNLFSGEFDNGNKKILLPLTPEYVGYADAHISGSHFVSVRPNIERVQHNNIDGFFKYHIDFQALEMLPEWERGEIGAICCSRPTNPTANVLTNQEMARLDALAKKHNVPLIIDNAYGAPFPNIIHIDNELIWHDNIILCFSLSKIGLPSVRTGIVLANTEVIEAITSLNAIINLSPTRLGAAIIKPMLQDGSLKKLSNNVIRPFYAEQAQYAISLLQKELKNYPLSIHQPEGAIFLWLWFENLPISTNMLYELLKQRGTLIMPSEPFFVGIDTSEYRHAHECIRMSIAGNKHTLEQGISTISALVRELYDHQSA